MVLPTIALELDDHSQAREQSYAQEQKSLPLQKFLGEQEMFVQDWWFSQIHIISAGGEAVKPILSDVTPRTF